MSWMDIDSLFYPILEIIFADYFLIIKLCFNSLFFIFWDEWWWEEVDAGDCV